MTTSHPQQPNPTADRPPMHKPQASVPSPRTQVSQATASYRGRSASVASTGSRTPRSGRAPGLSGDAPLSVFPSVSVQPVVLVRAEYTYVPQREDELAFQVGDVVEITDNSPGPEGWWKGFHPRNGTCGLVPSNFVNFLGINAAWKKLFGHVIFPPAHIVEALAESFASAQAHSSPVAVNATVAAPAEPVWKPVRQSVPGPGTPVAAYPAEFWDKVTSMVAYPNGVGNPNGPAPAGMRRAVT
eukprot:NODE_4303_length_795_cov_6.215569_g4280_i0.p1 GENE.NODE_4303_length_795_cov_6.215569_g4280_i0~~NODE_4303_length_795_cov_6.215569_g4280_i0.p1  ORF type:complete len:256 (-),score=32.22 NODE_4303_length_795_cov_6.215569_g4280_i0:26-751(-)